MGTWFTCPLGPVGSVIRIEGVGDFRSAAVDLRRTDSMTEKEAEKLTGFLQELLSFRGRLLERVKRQWNTDHPSQPWGAWAWFVEIERMEG